MHNHFLSLYFKVLILFLDVIGESEPLWFPGKWKKNTEGKEEENSSEARMGCKSRWESSHHSVMVEDMVLVTYDGVLKGLTM
jgi:hypothetical protein